MFSLSPKKECLIPFSLGIVKYAVLQLCAEKPKNYRLISDNNILNEIVILKRPRLFEPGYFIVFSFCKMFESETLLTVELCRQHGFISTAYEASAANKILAGLLGRFSSSVEFCDKSHIFL
jgi:hypothetical protein